MTSPRHRPETFTPTTTLLERAGYTVHAIPLPSVGASPHLKSFDSDVSLIRSTVDGLLSQGKDVVMVYHSYGGSAGSQALSEYVGKSESERKKGDEGKVRRLVYCCAFVLPEGNSLMTALGEKLLPWFIIDVRSMSRHPSTYAAVLMVMLGG